METKLGLQKGYVMIADQNLTANFADLGGPIDMHGNQGIVFWLDVEVGTSTNIQIRAKAMFSENGEEGEFDFPIETINASLDKLNPLVFELTSLADQKLLLTVNTGNQVPFIKIQVKDSAGGSGKIKAAYYTKS